MSNFMNHFRAQKQVWHQFYYCSQVNFGAGSSLIGQFWTYSVPQQVLAKVTLKLTTLTSPKSKESLQTMAKKLCIQVQGKKRHWKLTMASKQGSSCIRPSIEVFFSRKRRLLLCLEKMHFFEPEQSKERRRRRRRQSKAALQSLAKAAASPTCQLLLAQLTEALLQRGILSDLDETRQSA